MDVLVLNAGWEPIGRTTWRRAVALDHNQEVEVLERYKDRLVRTSSKTVQVPSVIRLFKMVPAFSRSAKFSRHNVYSRDRGLCQYCRKSVALDEATYDHVVPRKSGGQTRWENVVIACVPCNQQKGGRTPDEARMKLLVPPVRPRSLPATLRISFSRGKKVPESWRNYLGSWMRDLEYWVGELESD